MNLDKNQIRAIIFTGIAILGIILLFLIISILSIINKKDTNYDIDVSGGYDSIKQLIESYNCEYINDTFVKNREYPTEVNLVFKCNLYENEESNEKFFNSIIKDIAKYVKYTNVKMIDSTRDITIEIICENSKIYKIIINGIEDYFIYMDSQLSLTRYEEIDAINLIVEDATLIELINNRWMSNIDFGTRESIFKNYNICFDEGIEYRKIGSNVYNIIYTTKHNGAVVNGLTVGIDIDDVEDYLGKPTFKDEELKVIGYKGNDIYVFFTEDEISVYKNIEYDYDDFWKLCDEFLNDKLDFKSFMNELTYLWGDYSEYTYDSDYMFISYPNRGVDVKLNYEEISGIILYNNMSESLSTIKKYLNHTEFVSRLKLDNVFEAEKRRVQAENNIDNSCEEFKKILEEQDGEEGLINKESYLYNYYMDVDNMGNTVTTYFISKDKNNVNRELNEPVDTFLWINDYCFVYSIYGKGIYIYNVIDGTRTNLTNEVNEKHAFIINSYEAGILTFDDTEKINIIY